MSLKSTIKGIWKDLTKPKIIVKIINNNSNNIPINKKRSKIKRI